MLTLSPPDLPRNPGFPAASRCLLPRTASRRALAETPSKPQSEGHEAALFTGASRPRVCRLVVRGHTDVSPSSLAPSASRQRAAAKPAAPGEGGHRARPRAARRHSVTETPGTEEGVKFSDHKSQLIS